MTSCSAGIVIKVILFMSKKIIKLLNYKKNKLKSEEVKLLTSIQKKTRKLKDLDGEQVELKKSVDFLLGDNVVFLKSAIDDYYSTALENKIEYSKIVDTKIDEINACIESERKELKFNCSKSKAITRHIESVDHKISETNRYIIQHNQQSEILDQILYETD